MKKKKHIWIHVLIILGINMVIVGVCGLCFVAYLNGAVLSDPIEFTVSSRYYGERDNLYLTALEFDRPQFYTINEDDIKVIQEIISDGDKISVLVYDYNRGESAYYIAELQKDGEILYTHTSDGDGGRSDYIGLGIVLGIGVLLTVFSTVLYIKIKRKNDNLRIQNE